MRHVTEEELIAYREGLASQRAVISQHLGACEECRAELQWIEAVLAALDTLPVPDPGADYGRRVWQQIAPRLPEKPTRSWRVWIEPGRLTALGAITALIIAAFWIGRVTKRDHAIGDVASREQVRERVLVVAGGRDLGRSEIMLVDVSNAQPIDPAQKLDEHHLGASPVLAHGHHQHALANLLPAGDVSDGVISLGHPPDPKRRDNQRSYGAQGRQPPWLNPHPPRAGWFFRKPRRNLLPHAPAVIRARIGHRQRIQRRENGFDPLQLRATLFTGPQML